MKTVFPYCIIFILILSCCGKSNNRLHLEAINAIAETDGRQALAMLDSVKDLDYNEKERAYFNLLTIKSRDKAYIDPQNDSLIKEVLEYYERNEGEDYAEALYYGGRVYSDLGNYPTSLEYYQKALSELPDDDGDHRLKGRVVSQLGGLLIELRLYNQAIPYLEKSIEYDKLDRDSFNLAFDYELLAQVCFNQKDYDKAESYVKQALGAIKNSDKENISNLNGLLAEIKLYKGETDKALSLIRACIDFESTDIRYFIRASKIYYKNNIIDTAYIYARKIVEDSSIESKRAGYRMLMTPEIQKCIPRDTLLSYCKEYNTILEDGVEDAQEVLFQTSRYSFELQSRERKEANKSRKDLFAWVLILSTVLMIFTTVVCVLGIRENRHVIEIRKAQQHIDELKSRFDKFNNREREIVPTLQFNTEPVECIDLPLEKMRNELILMSENDDLVDSMSDFKSTEIYLTLCQKLEDNRVVI